MRLSRAVLGALAATAVLAGCGHAPRTVAASTPVPTSVSPFPANDVQRALVDQWEHHYDNRQRLAMCTYWAQDPDAAATALATPEISAYDLADFFSVVCDLD